MKLNEREPPYRLDQWSVCVRQNSLSANFPSGIILAFYTKSLIPLVQAMKTYSAKPAEVKRDWYVVDADGKALGRLSSEIARRLRGKHKAEYTPHVDTGDYIIVINAEKVRVTGNKEEDKIYYHHTGYIGHMKAVSLGKLRKSHPERIIQTAVKGMLPNNPLGRAMLGKLKVYSGPVHAHQAQQPKALEI
jgi:large subunit ribosomal protein L13